MPEMSTVFLKKRSFADAQDDINDQDDKKIFYDTEGNSEVKISLDNDNKFIEESDKENAKKTALDGDADIYRARTQKSASDTFKDLKGKAKFRYFVDYYLGKVLLGLAIAALLGGLVYTMLKPKKETVFYTAVVVSPFYPEAKEQLAEDLLNICGSDPDKEQVIIDDNYSSLIADYNSSLSYTMHMSAGEVDMVILTKEELKYQVNNRAVIPVEQAISKEVFDKLPDSVKHTLLPTYLLDNGDMEEGTEAVYGLNIEKYLEKANGIETSNRYVVAFTEISKHKDKFDAVVKYLFDIS